jgi:hypothetical protein
VGLWGGRVWVVWVGLCRACGRGCAGNRQGAGKWSEGGSVPLDGPNDASRCLGGELAGIQSEILYWFGAIYLNYNPPEANLPERPI